MTGRPGGYGRPSKTAEPPEKIRYRHRARLVLPAQSGELADHRARLRSDIAQAKAEIGGRHKHQRSALQALIAAEFASRMADAMRAIPESARH